MGQRLRPTDKNGILECEAGAGGGQQSSAKTGNQTLTLTPHGNHCRSQRATLGSGL